jgi:hypothetical protein
MAFRSQFFPKSASDVLPWAFVVRGSHVGKKVPRNFLRRPRRNLRTQIRRGENEFTSVFPKPAGAVLPPARKQHRRTGDSAMTVRKTECPITREEFLTQAKSVEVVINGQTVVAEVREFSTGSFGWHIGDKLTLKVGDTLLRAQMGLMLTVIGSKDVPRIEGAKEAA